ncbi:putative vacuolar membrane protein [Naematelia encephala]|uniref:E3 ubiquitin-protein ligase PEP5 n=1 Tax=Naematelia encephala TaxID=71784 RepID=A0A1Y2B934_9TREE|nr:putative vacuolar membrane protein [Naematelia encephala]
MAASTSAGPSQGSSLSAPQWRQFTFFDVEDVKDAEDLASSPRALQDLRPPIVFTPTSQQSPLPPSVILSSGTDVFILDRRFAVERSFRAWEGNGRGTALLEAGGLLVGIGEDEGSRYPVLKVWDLTRDEKKKAGGGPVLLRNVRIQHGQRPHPVSSIALTSTLSHLAIGLGDGTVLLYRHLLQSLTTSPGALTSLPKARLVHESAEPITGLGFREPPNTPAANGSSRAPDSDKASTGQLSLFIVTTNRILCAPVSGKAGEARTIDELGSGLGCAVMDWDRREMVVARDEAIYLYGSEGRGACYAYEGPKSSISVFRHNLIIASPPFFPSANSASATVRNYVSKAAASGSDGNDISKLTIFDLQNKVVSYSGTFKNGVREVFFQWGGVFVLGGDGKLSRLDEHSTAAKLDVLYRRNLFTLAISLARSQGVSEAGIADIHRRYGDYLYGKGDYDGAMSQFVKTLSFLQPSYVIRKFLDAQRIHNLTTYLQELHSRGLANPDHTTLLLNCYTKTSDRARLDAFIKTEASRGSTDLDDLPFDLDTAIRVCRQAGFYEHATYLAKKYGRHEEYLRIQIEDAQEWTDALKYLRSLGPDACQENLVLYGKTLLSHEPEATTDLLIDLCSGDLGKIKPEREATTDSAKGANGSSGQGPLTYLGLNRVQGLFTNDGQSRSATLVEGEPTNGDARGPKAPQDGSITAPLADAMDLDAGPSYIPPSPRTYFAHFVGQHELFIRFLESVAAKLWGQSVDSSPPARSGPMPLREIDIEPSEDPVDSDQRAVWNTLLELYLTWTKSSDRSVVRIARGKAMSLLARGTEIPYDTMHALILCSSAGFTDGLVGLWESMGMYEDVLRFWMERDSASLHTTANGDGYVDTDGDSASPLPSDEVLRYLDLYGPSHPHLYPLVLRYLTSSSQILQRHPTQLQRLLNEIDERHIMPPLSVVQLLSRNNVASIGAVKEWLKSKVDELRQDVESDKSLVQSYRHETESKEGMLKELADIKVPEVFQVTRCAACGGQLDLPAVHFMCKHSYHQRCLSDSDPECILCARQNSIIREVRRNQTRLADRHDLFIDEVYEAEDGFGVVAGAFGRGLMTKQVEGEA